MSLAGEKDAYTAIDWTQSDFAYLKEKVREGQAVLFAGAGFSGDAFNKRGEHPPLGSDLGRALAGEAKLPYNGEDLPHVYQASRGTVGDRRLRELLTSYYDIAEYPGWYHIVRGTVWHRIYTTNIDNLFQRIYEKAPLHSQRLDTIVCPAAFKPQRVDLKEVQCVHLHGLIESPQPFTFTLAEFASLTARSNPWYQALIDDVSGQPVVFVGTRLAEPQFYHYLELRKARAGNGTHPAKSFLVDPSLTEIRRRALLDLNIIGVKAHASDFFEDLERAIPSTERSVPSVTGRVGATVPLVQGVLDRASGITQSFDSIRPTQLPVPRPARPSYFLFGAEPTWDDIEKHRDAIREVTSAFVSALRAQSDSFRCFVLHGHAGSGKTTTLMRAALECADSRCTVLFARNEGRPDLEDIQPFAEKLHERGERLFVFFDGLAQSLPSLHEHKSDLRTCVNLTLVCAEQTNVYAQRQHALDALRPVVHAMPDLARSDAEALIEKLEEFGCLGQLRGKTREQQVDLFMVHAKQQLLVAMKESTLGDRFDRILLKELQELDVDAQHAYVMCCLAVAQGAPGVYRRHLMAALGRTSRRQSVIFGESLRAILVPANSSGSMLRPRHRLIARCVGAELSSEDLRQVAVVALLQELSGDITPNEITRRSPAYLAYRGLINSDALYELFGGKPELVLEIFAGLRRNYDGDFLFWLQYGRANIRAGNLDMAENFIQQSLQIRPNGNFQARHQLGILFLMQSALSPNPGAMTERAQAGQAILKEQILTRGDIDSYPYGAYLTYVSRWFFAVGAVTSSKEWEDLRAVGREAVAKYPGDEAMREAQKEVERSYLMRTVKSP